MEENKLIAEFMGLRKGFTTVKYYHPVTRARVISNDTKEECFLIHEDDVTIYTDRPGFEWQDIDDENYLVTKVDGLKYDSDWNWLMAVVEKIESVEDGKYDVNILKNGTQIVDYSSGGIEICNNVGKIGYDEKIEHTYQAVVDFIKWYNKNK